MKQQPGTPTRTVIVNGVERTPEATPAPSVVYQTLINQREVLGDQLNRLENQRGELNRELQRGQVQGASKVGIENRIMAVDKRIADLEKQISGVDGQISTAAAVPFAISSHENMPPQGPPEEAFVLGGLFMIIVMLPLSIAMARRIWKKSTNAVAQIPSDLMARLARIEQAVDTSALEIERIGEGQRFITKLFSEGSKVPVLPSGKDSK